MVGLKTDVLCIINICLNSGHARVPWEFPNEVREQEGAESLIDVRNTPRCEQGQEGYQLGVVDQDPKSEESNFLVNQKNQLQHDEQKYDHHEKLAKRYNSLHLRILVVELQLNASPGLLL